MIWSYVISVILFITMFYLFKHLYINDITQRRAHMKMGWALMLILTQFVPFFNIVINSFLLFGLLFSINMNDFKLKGKLFDFLNKEI